MRIVSSTLAAMALAACSAPTSPIEKPVATPPRVTEPAPIVVDAPAYVVAEPSGEFSFRSLAPGKYRVQTWSERSGTPAESEVTIKEGGNEVVLDLKGGATQIGPDKFNKPRSK